MMRVDGGLATDVGLVRAVNEDSAIAEYPVYLVADGMGGYEAGDVASGLVADEFASGIGSETLDRGWLRDRIAAANDRVLTTGGGTTVTGAIAVQHEGAPCWLVFNVGDSRVYRRRGGGFAQISVDHSLVQEMVDSGMLAAELARVHPERNIVTRAIGTDEDPAADVWLLPAKTGDRLVICSDGLNSELDDDAIGAVALTEDRAQTVAEELVRQALAAGGRDNVTVVVVDVLDVDATTTGEAGGDSSDGAFDTRPLVRPDPRR